jgi:hypothetical protein
VIGEVLVVKFFVLFQRNNNNVSWHFTGDGRSPLFCGGYHRAKDERDMLTILERIRL